MKKPTFLSNRNIEVCGWDIILFVFYLAAFNASPELWQRAVILGLYIFGCYLIAKSEARFRAMKNIDTKPLPSEAIHLNVKINGKD